MHSLFLKRIIYYCFFGKKSRIYQCPFLNNRGRFHSQLLIWSLSLFIKFSKTKGVFFYEVEFLKDFPKICPLASSIRMKVQWVLFCFPLYKEMCSKVTQTSLKVFSSYQVGCLDQLHLVYLLQYCHLLVKV